MLGPSGHSSHLWGIGCCSVVTWSGLFTDGVVVRVLTWTCLVYLWQLHCGWPMHQIKGVRGRTGFECSRHAPCNCFASNFCMQNSKYALHYSCTQQGSIANLSADGWDYALHATISLRLDTYIGILVSLLFPGSFLGSIIA